MLMPIVSMNKMAMNESIAVTCCYRQVPTPTAVYWEVLNGGWIGSGYVRERIMRDAFVGMSDSWFDLGQDLVAKAGETKDVAAFVKSYSLVYGATNVTAAAQYWLRGPSVGGMTFPGVNPANPFLSLKTAVETVTGGNVTVGGNCDHDNGNCTYRTFVYPYKTNQHFESKAAHADIKKWADAHTAVQFSS